MSCPIFYRKQQSWDRNPSWPTTLLSNANTLINITFASPKKAKFPRKIHFIHVYVCTRRYLKK